MIPKGSIRNALEMRLSSSYNKCHKAKYLFLIQNKLQRPWILLDTLEGD